METGNWNFWLQAIYGRFRMLISYLENNTLYTYIRSVYTTYFVEYYQIFAKISDLQLPYAHIECYNISLSLSD